MTEPLDVHEVAALFGEALERPAEQRRAHVEAASISEAARQEVLSLLAAHEAAGPRPEALDPSRAAALLDEEALSEQEPGRCIGAYRIVREIGRGGMGVVYLAERADGAYDQEVALKLLPLWLRSDTGEQRFRRERQILARLSHPDIARLLDGGSSEEGLPYLVMELVEGVPLTQHAEAHGLDLEARLDLFLAVCRAVAYAHRDLVVHRDLKPSNILVTSDGKVKLLDFGVGKLLEDEEETESPLTRTGVLPMTPSYAAPEQILGQQLSTATDVYALGVVLYELLTGERPHHRDSHSPASMAAAVDTEVVTRPSELVGRRGDDLPAKRLARRLRGDVDTIVLTALQREPERRYPSAEALMGDLLRYREGLPIQARPDTAVYRAGRFLSRHLLGVVATAAVMLALAGGMATAIWQAGLARTAAELAREQTVRAEAVQEFLLDIFRANTSLQPDPIQARQTTARELLDLGAARIETAMVDAPAAKLGVVSVLSDLYHDLAIDDEAVRLRRQAVELARALHGPRSLEVAQELVSLAGSLHATVSVAERGDVLGEAATILEDLPEAPPMLRALLLIKRTEHDYSTDVERAVDHGRQAVAILETLPPSVQLADALYTKGLAHNFAGNYHRAADAFDRAIETSKQVDEFPRYYLPRYYALLADARYRTLDLEEARASARHALETATEVRGPEHVDTLQTTMRLGRLLFDSGATHAGLRLLRQARALAFETRGVEDPFHTPQTLLEHGYALIRAGDPEGGLEDVRAAIENRRIHRPGTVYLAQMLEIEAVGLLELGHGEAVDALLDEAAEIRTAANQARGTERWNQHVATRARRALARGETDEALAWMEEYAAAPTPAGGPSMEQIRLAVLRAELLQAAGDTAGAEAAATMALDVIGRLGLAELLALEKATALFVRGRVALARNDAAAAREPLERAAAIQEILLLPQSPVLARTRDALAAVQSRLAAHPDSG